MPRARGGRDRVAKSRAGDEDGEEEEGVMVQVGAWSH